MERPESAGSGGDREGALCKGREDPAPAKGKPGTARARWKLLGQREASFRCTSVNWNKENFDSSQCIFEVFTHYIFKIPDAICETYSFQQTTNGLHAILSWTIPLGQRLL
ncbi:hypothetical protein FKM82_010287 [Ascaphus truei]